MMVAVAAAALAGAASTIHCAAMCGPLAAFAGKGAKGAAQYHVARLLAYAAVGTIAGLTGARLAEWISGRWISALLSWSLAAAFLYSAWLLWGHRRSRRQQSVGLVQLGKAKKQLSVAARIAAHLPKHPAVIGGITALLPCGALYGGLLIAASAGSALGGGLAMLAFGAASALGLVGVSVIGARVQAVLGGKHRPVWLARGVAALLVLGAVMLVVRPIDSLRHADPAACCSAE